jgi:hypothetical protein
LAKNLGILREFLRRARRRTVRAVLLDQAVAAVGAAMAGAILLLFLGTQILDWYWLILLAAGSLVFGLYRTLRRIPSEYGLAQQVDLRLGLRDCLSTGYYFAGNGSNGQGSAELRELVAVRAAELSRSIPPESAVPARAPHYVYRTAALALVACLMFGIRYGVRGSLDLRPPLMESVIDFFRPSRLGAQARKAAAQRAAKLPPQQGLSLDQENLAEPAAIDENAFAPGDPIRAERRDVPARPDDEPIGASDEDSDGERASAGDGKQGDDRDGANQPGQKGQQKAKQPGEDSSLLDKMRDAFQNMLAKLKIETKTAESVQSASKTGKPGGTQKQSGEKGEASQDRAPGKGTPQPDQQGDQMAAGGENAQGQGSERNPERNPADGEKSGIGKSDGNKDIRDAEQLAAMGKISELFGKRQANLTGEVLVEVSASKPQGLRTPYSERGASHAEAGGEIHRDEIPLIYQQYVQQYFDEVRKQTPASTAPEPARQ